MSLDEFNTVVGLVSLVVGVVGFWWAIVVARQARDAAVSAEHASRDTRLEIVRNLLLTLVPDLNGVEQRLDEAVRTGHREGVANVLVEWRRRASQVQGLLEVHGAVDGAVVASLKRSVVLATQAKSAVAGKGAVQGATRGVCDQIAIVTNELQTYMAQLTATTEVMRQ